MRAAREAREGLRLVRGAAERQPAREGLAIAYLRVLRALTFPIDAAAGEYLAVMPPLHRERLWVISGGHEDLRVTRRERVPDAAIWTLIGGLVDAGAIQLTHVPHTALLPHLLATRQVSTSEAMRLLSHHRAA